MKICWKNLEKLVFNKKKFKWYDKSRNSYDIRICIICKEYFLGSGTQTHCSKKCSIKGVPKSKEAKRNMSESGKRKLFSEIHKQNLTLGQKKRYTKKEERDKTSKSTKGRVNSNKGKTLEEVYGEKRAEILRNNLSKLKKGKCFLTEGGIERIRQYMKKGGAAHANSFIKNPSKPQKELFDLVKEEFSNARINFPVLNYSLDIAIPEYKVAIEYDCWYWHNIEKDFIRQKKLEKEGWRFVRFQDRIPKKNELIMEIKKWII